MKKIPETFQECLALALRAWRGNRTQIEVCRRVDIRQGHYSNNGIPLTGKAP